VPGSGRQDGRVQQGSQPVAQRVVELDRTGRRFGPELDRRTLGRRGRLGPGDDGPAGDGRIVDPSGAGLLAAPASIPTLSQWGVLLLSGLLALLALRRGSGYKANRP